MPYNVDNPPKRIRGLSEKKQRQWVEVFNSCLKNHDEATCYAMAWGVAKKASCEGRTHGISETDGSLADATRNLDLLNDKDRVAAQELMAIARGLSSIDGFKQ